MDAELNHAITHVIFLIFTGTALLATLALFTRQALLVAYIVLGVVLGPWGLKLINNAEIIKQAGDVGIIFLLFLLGLELQPQNLFHSLRKMSLLTLATSLIFFLAGFIITYLMQYPLQESIIIGIACMFSSTIIGLKLLPTTILHHQHTGELTISILLLQDVIAIAAILALQIMAGHNSHIYLLMLGLPVLILMGMLFPRYLLTPLLARFDKIHEYIFILSIGWCLWMAELSHFFGLSEEIGAFIGGVSLATNPISSYIAESLKPLRDFFLVLFFFSIGASFDFAYINQVIATACLLATAMLVLKPVVFGYLLQKEGELSSVSIEIGIRLSQLSEFSLLLIYMAFETHMMSEQTLYMAEASVLITFIVSCYWTVLKYPTPLAPIDRLRQD